jgi:DNA-directed RNA polymerase specialized sigma24 family protein
MAKDDVTDFVVWLYPRLEKAIERYEDKGFCFRTYLSSFVKLSSMEYRRTERERRQAEKSYWNIVTPATSEHEVQPSLNPETIYINTIPNDASSVLGKLKVSVKQIKILLLKSHQQVNDDILHLVSKHYNLSYKSLHALIDKMKALREEQDKNIWLVRERMYSQYHRLMSYQSKLLNESPGSYKYQALQDLVSLHKRRLDSIRRRYKHMHHGASNKLVAKVLGIPKGTVDSALHAIHKRLDE